MRFSVADSDVAVCWKYDRDVGACVCSALGAQAGEGADSGEVDGNGGAAAHAGGAADARAAQAADGTTCGRAGVGNVDQDRRVVCDRSGGAQCSPEQAPGGGRAWVGHLEGSDRDMVGEPREREVTAAPLVVEEVAALDQRAEQSVTSVAPATLVKRQQPGQVLVAAGRNDPGVAGAELPARDGGGLAEAALAVQPRRVGGGV